MSAEIEGSVSIDTKETTTKSNLYVVRHGESIANTTLRLDRDPALTEKGRQQAIQAGEKLKGLIGLSQPSAIAHTGLMRTEATAILLAQAGEFDASSAAMPLFRERELGKFSKIDYPSLLSQKPELVPYYEIYGRSCVWLLEDVESGVEPLTAMQERIQEGVEKLHIVYGDNPVILVTHAGPMKLIKRLYEASNLSLVDYLCSFVPQNGEIYVTLKTSIL